MVILEIDMKQLERNHNKRIKLVPKAVKVGLNAAHAHVLKKAPGRISKLTGIKVMDIKKEIFLKKKATVRDPRAIIAFKKKGFGLNYFKARQTATGVTAFPYRKESKFKSAFIVKGAGRFAGQVFRRKGKARLPIHWPAVVKITLNDKVFKDMEFSMNKVFHRAFKKTMDKG